MFFLSNLSEYGRGKDKRPRKKRNIIIGAIGGTAIGAGIGGYVGGNDSKVRALQNNTFKKTDRMWKIHGWKEADPEKYDELKKMFMGEEGLKKSKEHLVDIERFSDRFPKSNKARLNNKLNQIRNVAIKKGALIGSGIGLAAGLGGTYLYNKLRSNNENKR
jgi:hypothetical protein